MVNSIINWVTVHIIPQYSIRPLTLMVVTNAICYYGTLPYTQNKFHYDLSMPIDYRIPFLSIFIIPYVLAYGQWIIGYICISRESEMRCEEICYGEIISKLITGFIFIVMPTTMVRHTIGNGGIFNEMVAIIYASDPATNLFPSIHCMESWVCLRGTFSSDWFPKWYRIAMLLMTILVFASTVFVKQHVLVDVAGGVLVAELGLMMSRKFNLKRIAMESTKMLAK